MTVSTAAITDEAIRRKGVPTYPVTPDVRHMLPGINWLDWTAPHFDRNTTRFDSLLHSGETVQANSAPVLHANCQNYLCKSRRDKTICHSPMQRVNPDTLSGGRFVMPDALSRWCLFCDAEVHSGARNGPRVSFEDYVDDIIARSRRGDAIRVYERNNRVMRIADARKVDLPSGHQGLAMVLTLGDRRGSNPSFVHFARGHARDPERQDGEVKGLSAHCLIELRENENHVGRHRMLLEDATGMGRTPVSRLLGSIFRGISTDRDERFRSPDTGGLIQLRPVIEVWPQQSRQMQDALERGTLSVVELYDTGRVAAFDEEPDFRVKKRVLKVEVLAADGGVRGALERLRQLGRQEGYGNMKVSWRLPDGQVANSDVRTDLEDLGTALLARRELVSVETAMSDATDRLNDEFVEAMMVHFV